MQRREQVTNRSTKIPANGDNATATPVQTDGDPVDIPHQTFNERQKKQEIIPPPPEQTEKRVPFPHDDIKQITSKLCMLYTLSNGSYLPTCHTFA